MDVDKQNSFVIFRPKRVSDNTDAVSRLAHVPITSPGSIIPTEDHSVRARGTLLSNTESGSVLTATRAGVISRVNKLVMVMPLRARYIPETGDVVVGRVVEIASKRYRIDVNATKHAFLLLTAINLPGGVQRRRNQEDELNMRKYFKEGDLVSAEVQEQRKDGTVALHTRSLRYGKLSGGQLVTVQSELVKRAKKHFHELPCGVHTILGNNGYVFLSSMQNGPLSVEMRRRIARVANSVLALDSEFIAIGPDTIMDAYETSISNSVQVKDMCQPDIMRSICMGARSMRDAA
ncbi:unnamed protein product [Agarophyton chilense]